MKRCTSVSSTSAGKQGIIVYYVFGIVHVRNLQLIAASLPDWTFRVIYEPASTIDVRDLEKLPFEKAPFKNYQVPAEIRSEKVCAIIFSVIHLRPAPLNLLKYGLEHGIPTIAIEESNQMAMNKYLKNAHRNFIYPADHILAASEFEKSELIEAGVPEHRVRVTGWPFYSGSVGKVGPQRQRQARKDLGLDPGRPVAALTLNAIGYADENFDSLKKQLVLSAQGLPSEYQLLIKPHPIEKQEIINPFIKMYAPEAVVLEGTMPVRILLEASDLLLNRGVSQVVLEALVQELPVVILSTGVRSPFHGQLDQFIAEKPHDLTAIVNRLASEPSPQKFYADFRKLHVPYSPEKAGRLTCRHIEQIASRKILDPRPEQQWLELGLYQAFRVDRRQALSSLTSDCLREKKTKQALKRLIEFRATRSQLEELKQWTAGGFKEQALRSLWIDQLSHKHAAVTDSDLDWLREFPPPMCFSYFYHHTMLWFDLLLRAGLKQEILELADRMRNDYGYIPEIKQIIRGVELFQQGGLGRLKYEIWRLYKQARAFLRRFAWLTQLANRIG